MRNFLSLYLKSVTLQVHIPFKQPCRKVYASNIGYARKTSKVIEKYRYLFMYLSASKVVVRQKIYPTTPDLRLRPTDSLIKYMVYRKNESWI